MKLDYQELAPEATKSLYALSRAVASGPLNDGLRELIAVYVSILNRCAHCIAVHWKKAQRAGVPETKLRLLPAFGESGGFTEAERAALAFAERLTRLEQRSSRSKTVPQDIWADLESLFDRETIVALMYQVILMNAWNRLSIALEIEPPAS